MFKRLSRSHWILLAIAVFILTLFFGLRPKGFYFLNNVDWIVDGAGIHFNRYGIAYTALDNRFGTHGLSGLDQFSIEIAFRPANFTQEGFTFLMSVHDVNDRGQLLVGQWKSYIIVMNGDDYSNKRKIPRITAKMVFNNSPENILLSVTTGIKGTNLYF